MKIIHQSKKQFLIHAILGFLAISFCSSCMDDRFEQIEKYQRPEWLEGKIYTQISGQENMTIFSQFMKETGFAELLDKTGTYAVFVPSDSVMRIFLMDRYGTQNASELDVSIMADIVRYHVVPMPWSKSQLQLLNARGWINMTDISNNEPNAFKRRTLFREPNKTYNIRRFLSGSNPYDIILPDHVPSSTTRTVFTRSQKYVPLFFDGFMNAENLTSSDYSFYFNRLYESGQIYYANAKIIGDEIFAENGFVFTIDKVTEPLKNAEQLLKDGPYTQFLQLIHNNSVFQFNQQATQAQEGADQGAEVTQLYNLSYPAIAFNIHDELVGGEHNNTMERHPGLLAPTDEAMDTFFNTYLKVWGSSWNSVPGNIQRIIVNAHMTENSIFKKDINAGFYNAINDKIKEDDITVRNAIFGSNCTFIGLDEVIVPKFFSSVSAPLFLNPNYSAFFGAYSEVNLLSALKDQTTDYSLFLIDDSSLSIDSSLFVMEIPNSPGRFSVQAFDYSTENNVNMLSGNYRGILTRRLFGQIGIQPILGFAKREFIETLDGRHIVVQGDTVSGGASSKFGFNSPRDTTVVFSEITNLNASNGRMYSSNGWLEFPTENTYGRLAGTKFLTLLNKVGLASISNERLTFINPTERYTIFVPSDAALNSMQVDTLSLEDLRKLVSFHIVRGQLIFTDGRQPQGAYRTLNNQLIHLNPQPDNLIILDKNYNVYYDQLILSSGANLIGMHLQNASEGYYVSNSVIHHIETVIMPY